jgi:DNA-directed RNA polymerase subunit RPC12/RpoP
MSGRNRADDDLLPPLTERWIRCPRCGTDFVESERRENIRIGVDLYCPSCGERRLRKDGPGARDEASEAMNPPGEAGFSPTVEFARRTAGPPRVPRQP